MAKLVLAVLVAALGVRAQAIALVEKGRAAEIRLPAGADVSSRHAAEEIATYVEKMSGVRPLIVEGLGDGGTVPRVVVGTLAKLQGAPDDLRRRLEAERSYEAGALSVRGETLWVVGKEPVAEVYAAYRLLDRLGVKWLQIPTKEDPGEFVPSRREIVVEPFEEVRAPAFERRYLTQVCSWYWPIPTNSIDFLVRCGLQGRSCVACPYPLGREKKVDLKTWNDFFYSRLSARLQTLGGGHVMFTGAIPPEKYFASHPEYFALVDGERRQAKQRQYQQYCLSNPDVVRLVAEDVIARLDRFGGRGSYLFGNADSVYGWCECDGCRALDPPGGRMVDVSTRFNKTVAKIDALVRKRWPDADLQLWAYSNYRTIPVGVTPNKKVNVEFCDHGRCQAHRLDDPSCLRNVSMFALLKDWLKVGSSLHTYEYLTDSDWNYSCFTRMEADTLKLYRSLGVSGFSNEGHFPDSKVVAPYGTAAFFDNQPSNWQYFYVVGRLAWNPDLDVEALLEECETLYYGKAARPMREYHQFRRKLWDARRECVGYSTGNQRTPLLLSAPGSKEKLLGLLDEADRIAAAANDAILKHRLANDRRWLVEYWIKPHEKILAKMERALYAPRPTGAIAIDGNDDEGAWAGAQYVEAFASPAATGKTNAIPAALKTTVGILADDENWYFFIRTKDPAAKKAKFAADPAPAWEGCGAEIFLFPPSVENRYCQVAANPLGRVTATLRPGDEPLKSKIRAAGRVTDDGWTVEIRIPSRGLHPLRAGDVWRINVCRNRTIRDELTPKGGNWSIYGIGYHDTTDYQPVTVGKPYLVNGSFTDLDDKGRPKGWDFSGKRSEVVPGKAGNAVRLRGSVMQSLWRGALRQSPKPRTFDFSFRAKGPGAVSVFFPRYRDDEDPKAPNGYRRTFYPESGSGGKFETTGGWSVYTGSYTVAPDEWVSIGLSAEGVLVDDVSVRPRPDVNE